jgi:hypothetical protein
MKAVTYHVIATRVGGLGGWGLTRRGRTTDNIRLTTDFYSDS